MWKPVFDDQVVSNFGDIAISESNPKYYMLGQESNKIDKVQLGVMAFINL